MSVYSRAAAGADAPSLVANVATNQVAGAGERIANFGTVSLSVAIAVVLGWIGAMKFTAFEAGAIQGLVQSSPFVSWLYDVSSVQGVSNLIGTIEIATAIAIVAGLRFARVGLIGALAAAFTFLLTLSFLFTAPGWEESLGGFPALSVVPGQFLLKDVVLLAGSIFLVGDALRRIATNR